ncbi:glycosyltransferase family 25 protein [Vibrio paucivorans]
MIKTFVIHVSKGYEERREHIDRHLPLHGITEYEYMLRGDIDDLGDEVIDGFFGDVLRLPEKSCFYKHYLVMKEVVENEIPEVLVLEDDVILGRGFISKLEQVQQELALEKFYVVNIEDAATSVPVSTRKKGKLLYQSSVNKLTGGLVYNLAFAKAMVRKMESIVVDDPIDAYIGNFNRELGYKIFWCQPPLLSQGSKKGLFSSELNGSKAGLYYRVRSSIKHFYRRNILSNLSRKQKDLF